MLLQAFYEGVLQDRFMNLQFGPRFRNIANGASYGETIWPDDLCAFLGFLLAATIGDLCPLFCGHPLAYYRPPVCRRLGNIGRRCFHPLTERYAMGFN
jgi:hypothetical protein